MFAYIVDGSPEELQSALDITLRRFAEYHNLQGAFGRRAQTERAKGILMERYQIDERQAFEMLRDHARHSGQKLVHVAGPILESHPLLPVTNSVDAMVRDELDRADAVTDPDAAGGPDTGETPSLPPATPPPEPARRRHARHAHRALLYLCAVVVILLLIVVIVLSAANARAVELDWVFGSTETSLVWVVVGAAVIGWLIGIATAAIFRFRTRPRRS